MPKSKDLFDNSEMSFGDHLEELRKHVIKALVGVAIGTVICLMVGQHIVGFVQKPIDAALLRQGLKKHKVEDIGQFSFFDYFQMWLNPDEAKKFEDEQKKKLEQKEKENEEESKDEQEEKEANKKTSKESSEETAEKQTEEKTEKKSSEKKNTEKKDTQKKNTEKPTTEAPSTDDENTSIQSSKNPEDVKLQGTKLTITLNAKDIANALNQVDPESYPAPKKDAKDFIFPIVIDSSEFALYRDVVKDSNKPVVLTVQEGFMMYLKVSFIAGLVLTSPWVFYQGWLFVAVGLYENERKYVHIYGTVSLGLFLAGAAFCFYLVFPVVLDFLLAFSYSLEVKPQIRLTEWISFAVMLPVMFGLSFQLPLVMLFLERLSIFEEKVYREQRRMAILVIAILSMFLTPAEPISMIMMMVPLMFLYEMGIMLCKYSPSASPFDAETA